MDLRIFNGEITGEWTHLKMTRKGVVSLLIDLRRKSPGMYPNRHSREIRGRIITEQHPTKVKYVGIRNQLVFVDMDSYENHPKFKVSISGTDPY